MPKSSRHKSRSRKHGELEDDGSSRDRKVKAEDSAARVSKSSAGSKEMSNGEKKRKERAGESVVVVDDRWNGGAEDEHVGDKKAKSDFVEVVEMDKAASGKLKVSVGESKSRRGERDVEVGGVRVEVVKLKGEKESSRRDSSGSHKKDLKEREAKDRDRDYSKEVKEKERDTDVKVKERDHGKDSKERDRDHGKDLKEKERDSIKELKERDRDSSRDMKEKDRDYNRDVKDRNYSKDVKEKDRDYSKDAKEKERDHSKDVKERDRDHSKDVKERDRETGKEAKERDREHPKDVKQRDRDHPKDVKEHSRDVKERERDNSKDPKERERDPTNEGKDKDHTRDPKERDRDHTRDAKEKDRDHPKDTKERDAKDRDRDHQKEVKERERDYYKEDRNRDYYKDAKDRDRESYKDVKERDRDYPKDGRERDREYIRDTKERDYSKDGRERERDYHRDARDRDRDYKDGRDKDRERGTERDKRVQDVRNERSDDVVSRKQASKIIPTGEDYGSKKNIEISGGQTQDGVRNHELEKEIEKNVRRRDSSGDKGKYLGDLRDIDDRRLSSRDDHTKNSSHKDDNQRDGRYRDRYREDLDRDQRDRDDRGRDERSTREHTNSKSGNKHYRDDTRVPEVYYKKSKIQDTDHDNGPYIDDHGAKLKDNRGRKVFADETDDAIDLKLRGAKDPHEEIDPRSDRGRMDYMHADKVDNNLGRPKSSPGSGNHTMMDQFRTNSKQVGSSGRKSSEEKLRANAASRGDNIVVAGVHERDSESRLLEKRRPKEGVRSSEVEHAAPHYDRTPKSDARPSQSSLMQKSPSTGSDRRFSDKNGPRRNFDFEGHKSNSSRYGRDFSNSKDRDRGLPFERSMSNDLFRAEKFDSDSIQTGPPFNRTSNLSGSSPSHLPPPPQGGHGTGIPSVLGTYEDENRSQIGDRKPNSRFRRNGDHGMGRGQVNAYKGPPTWQSPGPNGFISLQHVPPHPGFHPSVQQFPSPYGGVRPPMDFGQTVSPYQMHEVSDRFPVHGRSYGWHNPMDDCPPMPAWDGRNSAFSDDPHMYGRAEWDISRQITGTRGWPNGNINMEHPLPAESEYPSHNEAWTGQTGSQSRKDRDPSECLPTVNSEVKNSNDKSPAKNSIENPQRSLHEKTSDPFKPTGQETTSIANGYSKIHLCCNYLSKLDISLDLAQSDLYQNCMSLLGPKDKAGVYDHVSKEKISQNGKGDRIVAAGGRYDLLSAVFPTRTDAIFQRAMSLYKKHNGKKENSSASLSSCAEEKRGSSEGLESETPNAIAVDLQRTSAESPAVEEVMVADIQTSLDTPMPNADCTSVFGEEKNTPMDPESSGPSKALERQSGSISDTAHFDDDSQSCDALMAECRVNVSRIHLSPGSTH